jgi:hypothetical protein
MRVVRYTEDKKSGERIPDKSPYLVTKLICSKKNGLRIVTKFYLENVVDKKGEPVEIDPEQLMEKRNDMDAYVLIEGLYAGSDIYAQIKLWEAHLTPYTGNGLKRLKPKVECVTVMSDESPFADFVKKGRDHKDDRKISKEQVRKNIQDNTASDDESEPNPMNLQSLPPAPTPAPQDDSSGKRPRRSKRNAPSDLD